MVDKIITSIILCLLLMGCNNSDDKKIQITLKVIDSYTKQARKGDRVEVRMAKWGFPTRRYVEVGQYSTDSSGIVKLNIFKNERYTFMTFGANDAFGSDEYGKEELKNNQQVVIEVVPPDKKQFKIEYQ